MSHDNQQTGLPSGLAEEKPKSMIKCKTSLLIVQLMGRVAADVYT
jgi:hypothetical protein